MKVKSEYFDKAINEYDKGRSIRDIRYILKQDYNYYPSKATIHRWIKKIISTKRERYRSNRYLLSSAGSFDIKCSGKDKC